MHELIAIAKGIVEHYGYFGIFFLTTIEQFIFPIPSDIFISTGTSLGLPFFNVLLVASIATILGSTLGYFLGKTLGHPVFVWIFGKKRLEKAENIIKRWGMLGIILVGFTPFPFKIITWSAGIFELPYRKFILGVLLGRIPRYILTAFAATLIIKTKFYATTDMSAIILGLMQGVTEFLPISSTGHLALLEHFLHLPIPKEQMEIFDILLHGASLLAILVFFYKDWIAVFKELWGMIKTRTIDRHSLALKLAIGTVPAIIAGLIFASPILNKLQSLTSIAICFLITGVLYLYTLIRKHPETHDTPNLKQSALIGLAQATALIPAISRSGFTILAGLFLGLKREAAARFSFMLGGVSIFAATCYAAISIGHGAVVPNMKFILFGVIPSFLSSLFAISFLIKYLQKHTLKVFGVYLLIIGTLILVLF